MPLVSSGSLVLDAREMVTLTVALNKFIDGRLVERKRRQNRGVWSEAEEAQLQRAITVRTRLVELRKQTPFKHTGGQ